MQSQQSVFDVNTFLETTHKGNLDTTYVLPDAGEYTAQITDKIAIRTGTRDDGTAWATIDIQWELLDEALKERLNMHKVLVRQSFFLDLNEHNQLDLGVNRNMRLKRLWEATGVNKQKQVSIGALKFQSAHVKVEHRQPEGFDDPMAEVTRVTSLDKARARNGA